MPTLEPDCRSVGTCAAMACVLEATAAKPGNVYRGADFADVSYVDFLASAVAIGPAMSAAASGERVGAAVRRAIEATRAVTSSNTNLGIVLLLAPLAKVRGNEEWVLGAAGVLAGLNAADAADVYEAIRAAKPGGLGKAAEYDVAESPPADLLEAMRLAADRDSVARQYARNFVDVFRVVVPALRVGIAAGWPLADVIVHAFLVTLSRLPDSLIARKCGWEVARRVSDQAAAVIGCGGPGEASYQDAVSELDFWLRGDGHRRNPGTTADLVTAGLFVCLRNGEVPLPLRFYGARE